MTATVRVLIADDHQLFRDGVRALLSVTPDLEVVGEAADASTAIELSLSLRPDVVLMDLHMPGGGLDAIAEVKAGAPEVAVLALTMLDDDESVLAAVRAGARGYVLKDTEPEDLVRAVLSAARGEAIFGRAVADRMLAQVSGRPGAAVPSQEPFGELTAGERAVLVLMARGCSNPVIATTLSISPKTVRNYVSSIFRKLQVEDRAMAIVQARQAGLHRQI